VTLPLAIETRFARPCALEVVADGDVRLAEAPGFQLHYVGVHETGPPETGDFAASLELEALHQAHCSQTEDHHEVVGAFREKRAGAGAETAGIRAGAAGDLDHGSAWKWSERSRLFHFRFLERDMLPHDRVVLVKLELCGLGASILLRHIKEPGIRRGYQFDLNRV